MKKIFLPLLFIATLAMMVVMYQTGASLKTAQTPLGILNLELPFTKAKADTVINAWKNTTNAKGISNITVANINTWWDFLFIICYSLFLFAACNKISAHFSGSFNKWGIQLGNAVFTAAALDAAENIGMFMMLNGNTGSIVVLITSLCSIIKWLLVFAILLYLLLGGTIALYAKIR
jgi:hypothetical protein